MGNADIPENHKPADTDNVSVWKYALEPSTPLHIFAPKYAQPLYVDVQRNGTVEIPHVWMLVRPAMPIVKHQFRVVGTGHNMMRKEAKQYVGTFTMLDKALVFHVFYNGEVD